MPEHDLKTLETALKGIQNIGIILTGATEFVCEEEMLKRFSRHLEADLKTLTAGIVSLKKGFPGKFPETPEPDNSLSRVTDIAAMLKRGTVDIEAKCQAGNLGNELTMTAGDLKQGIRHIQNTVNGSVSAYSLDDRIANYGGSVKSLFSGFSGLSSKAGRIILAALLVTCLAVGYLFFTMDFENTLFKSIERDFSYVQKQKITIAEKTNEYKEIRKKLEKLDQKDLTREDKIKLLSLAVEEAKIRDIIEQTKLSAKEKEKQIADKNKRLKKVREETFLRRLFRR